jgi:hypothetical protein
MSVFGRAFRIASQREMKTRFISVVTSSTIATALLFITAICAYATTITVTNTNDSGPGSLRQALLDANDFDTIDATGVSGTILLTSGALVVSSDVTILGPGPANLAIDGNATFRVFEVVVPAGHFNAGVVISGFTITNGVGNNANSTIGGGGIYNNDMVGTLTVENCVVSNNLSFVGVGCCQPGGGINNLEFLDISNSTITGNSAQGYYGGGIYNTGNLIISNSTISGNSGSVGGASTPTLLVT